MRSGRVKDRYIAFLRAINVGGHGVKMDRLRQLFESVGLSHVETFIASGNVIFVSASHNVSVLETRIEKALWTNLGYEVATFMRSEIELARMANLTPFARADLETTENGVYVALLREKPSRTATTRLMAFQSAENEFVLSDRELYWLRRGRVSDSKFSGALLEKALGSSATVRSWTTIKKLAAKFAPPPMGR